MTIIEIVHIVFVYVTQSKEASYLVRLCSQVINERRVRMSKAYARDACQACEL